MSSLPNTIGKNISQKILQQLKLRSKQNSKEYRDTENLVYLANKSAFLRVVSSVNIPSDEITKLKSSYANADIFLSEFNDNYKPSDLAKKFVLFAGTSKYGDKDGQQRSIYNLRSGLEKNGAYGMLGNEEIKSYGYRPMPGITSATIDTAGRMGSIRYCTINFRVWDKMQLDIVDLLYFKLGYSMFVEWGNTYYYKDLDGGRLHYGEEHCIDPFSKDNNDTTWKKEELNLRIIQENERSEGNYDAMLGLCTNFNFSMNQEGGYDCTIKIIGLGYLADSIKINQPTALSNIVAIEIKKLVDFEQKRLNEEAIKQDKLRNAQEKANFDANIKPGIEKEKEDILKKAGNNVIKEILVRYKLPLPKYISSDPNIVKNRLRGSEKINTYDELSEEAQNTINYKSLTGEELELLYNFLDKNKNIIYPPASYLGTIPPITIQDYSQLNYLVDNTTAILAPFKVIYDIDPQKNLQYKSQLNAQHLDLLINQLKIKPIEKNSQYFDDDVFSSFYNYNHPNPQVSINNKLFFSIAINPKSIKKLKDTGSADSILLDEVATRALIEDYLSIITKGEAGAKRIKNYDYSFRMLKIPFVYGKGENHRIRFQAYSTFELSIKDSIYSFEIGIFTNDTSVFSEITVDNEEYQLVDAESLLDQAEKLNTEFQETIGERIILDANTIQEEETSRYKSGLELALRATQLYALNKVGGSITSPTTVSLSGEKDFIKEIFSSAGLFSQIHDIILNPQKGFLKLDEKEEDRKKYLEDNVTGLERLSTNAMFGFSTGVLSAKNTKDLINAKRVDYKKLLNAYVVPYQISDSFLGTNEQIKLNNPVYVNLGFIMCMINHLCTIYEVGKDNSIATPMVYIDFNPETNYCLSSPNHISVDPLKFLVPCYANQKQLSELYDKSMIKKGKYIFKETSEYEIFDKNKSDYLSNIINKTSPFKDIQNAKNTSPYIGKIMNVLVNIDYILDVLDKFSSADGNGSVYLRSFIERIILDLNKSMGSFNVFRLAYNDQANTLLIIDDQVIPDYENTGQTSNSHVIRTLADSELPITYGKDTIARNLEIKTEISTKLANMLAISANPSQELRKSNSLDATSFGFFNKDVEDRYMPKKEDAAPNSFSSNSDSRALIKQYEQNANAAARFNYLMGRTYFGTEEMNPIDSAFTINYYTQAIAGVKSKSIGLASSVMIPVSLNFTTDGISGLSMYNTFTVPEEVLPYTYTSRKESDLIGGSLRKVGFCIVGLTHTLENNQWTTDIRTNMIFLKQSSDYGNEKLSVSSLQGSFIGTTTSSTGGYFEPRKITNAEQKNNELQVAKYLKSKGLNNYQIAAVMGHLSHEANFNPGLINPNDVGKRAIGIAQWRGSRDENLSKLPGSLTLPVQLDFLWSEFNTNSSGKAVVNATNFSSAFTAMAGFERYQGYNDPTSKQYLKRLTTAQYYLNDYLPKNINE